MVMVNRITDHLQMLSETIGVRPIGTKSNHLAASYIENHFKNLGLSIVKQTFACPNWAGFYAQISLGDSTYSALPNTFSPSCDVSGLITTASSIKELEKISGQGEVLLLYGELTKSPIVQKENQVYNPERDQKINAVLESKLPAAVITVSPLEQDIHPLINDWDLNIPSITVTASIGELLMHEKGKQAHIVIKTTSEQSSGWNVIGTKNSHSKKRIVVCAHFDSYHRAPGAFDNATGVAALLAVAESLSGQLFPFDIEFIAFNGEEYYAIGDLEYVKTADFDSIICAINIDGIAPKVGTNNITVMAASDEFQEQVKDILEAERDIKWTNPWYAGNHTTFLMRGVPSIALSSEGLEQICHLPSDTIENVDPDKIAQVVNLVEKIITMIADRG